MLSHQAINSRGSRGLSEKRLGLMSESAGSETQGQSVDGEGGVTHDGDIGAATLLKNKRSRHPIRADVTYRV